MSNSSTHIVPRADSTRISALPPNASCYLPRRISAHFWTSPKQQLVRSFVFLLWVLRMPSVQYSACIDRDQKRKGFPILCLFEYNYILYSVCACIDGCCSSVWWCLRGVFIVLVVFFKLIICFHVVCVLFLHQYE